MAAAGEIAPMTPDPERPLISMERPPWMLVATKDGMEDPVPLMVKSLYRGVPVVCAMTGTVTTRSMSDVIAIFILLFLYGEMEEGPVRKLAAILAVTRSLGRRIRAGPVGSRSTRSQIATTCCLIGGTVTDPLFMLLDPMRYRSESMVMATAATAAAITSPTRMKSRAR